MNMNEKYVNIGCLKVNYKIASKFLFDIYD